MSTVTRKLIAKELFVNRWFVGSATLAAALSIAVCTLGKMAFNIGALTWLTTIIAFGVMIAIYGVTNERKEHSLEFVLSLPISNGDYVRAKLLGLLLCFLAPWLVSTVAAVAMVLFSEVPDGLLPYTVALCLFLLTNFAVVLCGALHARTEAFTSAVIIVTNMGVSVFMFTVGALPGFRESMFGATPVWNDTFFWTIACEIALFFIALSLPLVFAARRRDFI
jgi:ABC-2 type transport system permease protein